MTKVDDIRSQARFPVESHILQLESDIQGISIGDISSTGVFIKNLNQLEVGQTFHFKVLFSMITLQKTASLQGKVARKTADGAGVALTFNSEKESKEWVSIVDTYKTYRKRTKAEQTRIKLKNPKKANVKIGGNLFPCIITEAGEDSLVISAQNLKPESNIEIIFDPFTSFQARVVYFSLDGYLVQLLNHRHAGKNHLENLLEESIEPSIKEDSPNQIKQILSWKQYKHLYENYISEKSYMLDNETLPSRSTTIQVNITVAHPRSKKSHKVFFETQLVRETLKGQKVLKISENSMPNLLRAKKIYEDIQMDEERRLKIVSFFEPKKILALVALIFVIYLSYAVLPNLLRAGPSAPVEPYLTADQSLRFKFLNNTKFTEPEEQIKNMVIPGLKLSEINFIKYDPAKAQTFLVIKKTDQELLITPEIQETLPEELKAMIQELISKS